MEMRNSYLLTHAECQSQPSWLIMSVVRKRDSAHDKAGSGEDGGVAIRGTTFVECRIQLDFRPEKPNDSALRDSILGDVIPGDSVSQAARIGYRQRSAGCRCERKLTEALSHRNRGRHDSAAASVAVLARRD